MWGPCIPWRRFTPATGRSDDSWSHLIPHTSTTGRFRGYRSKGGENKHTGGEEPRGEEPGGGTSGELEPWGEPTGGQIYTDSRGNLSSSATACTCWGGEGCCNGDYPSHPWDTTWQSTGHGNGHGTDNGWREWGLFKSSTNMLPMTTKAKCQSHGDINIFEFSTISGTLYCDTCHGLMAKTKKS